VTWSPYAVLDGESLVKFVFRTINLPILVLLTACGLPRDPSKTLDRVSGGTMRVGYVANPPWVIPHAGRDGVLSMDGVEGVLVQHLAQEIRAHIEWVAGTESELFDSLRQRKVDLLIGGINDATPWKKDVGLTRPYFAEPEPQALRHVMATPPGENGWLMRVEQTLREEKSQIPAMVEAAR
jgi:polar amino acid transport system substrate-binding protein